MPILPSNFNFTSPAPYYVAPLPNTLIPLPLISLPSSQVWKQIVDGAIKALQEIWYRQQMIQYSPIAQFVYPLHGNSGKNAAPGGDDEPPGKRQRTGPEEDLSKNDNGKRSGSSSPEPEKKRVKIEGSSEKGTSNKARYNQLLEQLKQINTKIEQLKNQPGGCCSTELEDLTAQQQAVQKEVAALEQLLNAERRKMMELKGELSISRANHLQMQTRLNTLLANENPSEAEMQELQMLLNEIPILAQNIQRMEKELEQQEQAQPQSVDVKREGAGSDSELPMQQESLSELEEKRERILDRVDQIEKDLERPGNARNSQLNQEWIHLIDVLATTNQQLKQALSDEIKRIKAALDNAQTLEERRGLQQRLIERKSLLSSLENAESQAERLTTPEDLETQLLNIVAQLKALEKAHESAAPEKKAELMLSIDRLRQEKKGLEEFLESLKEARERIKKIKSTISNNQQLSRDKGVVRLNLEQIAADYNKGFPVWEANPHPAVQQKLASSRTSYEAVQNKIATIIAEQRDCLAKDKALKAKLTLIQLEIKIAILQYELRVLQWQLLNSPEKTSLQVEIGNKQTSLSQLEQEQIEIQATQEREEKPDASTEEQQAQISNQVQEAWTQLFSHLESQNFSSFLDLVQMIHQTTPLSLPKMLELVKKLLEKEAYETLVKMLDLLSFNSQQMLPLISAHLISLADKKEVAKLQKAFSLLKPLLNLKELQVIISSLANNSGGLASLGLDSLNLFISVIESTFDNEEVAVYLENILYGYFISLVMKEEFEAARQFLISYKKVIDEHPLFKKRLFESLWQSELALHQMNLPEGFFENYPVIEGLASTQQLLLQLIQVVYADNFSLFGQFLEAIPPAYFLNPETTLIFFSILLQNEDTAFFFYFLKYLNKHQVLTIDAQKQLYLLYAAKKMSEAFLIHHNDIFSSTPIQYAPLEALSHGKPIEEEVEPFSSLEAAILASGNTFALNLLLQLPNAFSIEKLIVIAKTQENWQLLAFIMKNGSRIQKMTMTKVLSLDDFEKIAAASPSSFFNDSGELYLEFHDLCQQNSKLKSLVFGVQEKNQRSRP